MNQIKTSQKWLWWPLLGLAFWVLYALTTGIHSDILDDFRVYDDTTGKPIQGVVVFSGWRSSTSGWFARGAVSHCFDDRPHLTDASGRASASRITVLPMFTVFQRIWRGANIYKEGYRHVRGERNTMFLAPDTRPLYEQREKLERIWLSRCSQSRIDYNPLSSTFGLTWTCSPEMQLVKNEWEKIAAQITDPNAGCYRDQYGLNCPPPSDPITCISR